MKFRCLTRISLSFYLGILYRFLYIKVLFGEAYSDFCLYVQNFLYINTDFVSNHLYRSELSDLLKPNPLSGTSSMRLKMIQVLAVVGLLLSNNKQSVETRYRRPKARILGSDPCITVTEQCLSNLISSFGYFSRKRKCQILHYFAAQFSEM